MVVKLKGNSVSVGKMFWCRLILVSGILVTFDDCLGQSVNFGNSRANTSTILSRKKRYVAFPEGSSFSASICLTIGVIGNPNVNYLSWAENWGVAYNLPNYSWAKMHANGFNLNATKATVQRRSRRSLYKQIESIIEKMGFDGDACVARALCESAKFIDVSPAKRGNMIEEIVKTIFSLPSERVHEHEPPDVHHYDRVYRRARQRRAAVDCQQDYGRCKFSLLELALGKYLVPTGRSAANGGRKAVQNMKIFM